MLAQARKNSVNVCDNIRKRLDKILDQIKVVMSQNNQDKFELNWKKAFVGKIDASQKFEDRVFECRYDFYYYYKNSLYNTSKNNQKLYKSEFS